MPIKTSVSSRIGRMQNMIIRLPKNQEQELMRKSEDFSETVEGLAKENAPKWTEALARSIKSVRENKRTVNVVVNSPYGKLQEEGYPPHPVSIERRTRAGRTVKDWADDKGVNPSEGLLFVRRHTPFLQPAIEQALNRLPNMVPNANKKALIKSGAGG